MTEALRSRGLGTELAFKATSLISMQSALKSAGVYGCQLHTPRLGTQGWIRSARALEKLKVKGRSQIREQMFPERNKVPWKLGRGRGFPCTDERKRKEGFSEEVG